MLDSSSVVELSDDSFGTQFSSIESFIKTTENLCRSSSLLFGVVIVYVCSNNGDSNKHDFNCSEDYMRENCC